MAKLLMIADDLTGALDAGVMLSENKIKTIVPVDTDAGLYAAYECYEGIVVNSESRHISPEDAYKAVFHLAQKGKEMGIPYLYKKIDSALRGNIGTELEAALLAYGEQTLWLAPAFPRLGRTTISGMQYIDGRPLAASGFEEDILNPVVESFVPNIIARQSKLPVIMNGDKDLESIPSIRLFDAETDADLDAVARVALCQHSGRVFAGSSGLMGALAKNLSEKKAKRKILPPTLPVAFFCGSTHPNSKRQLDYLQTHSDAARYTLNSLDVIKKDYWDGKEGGRMIVELNDLIKKNRSVTVDFRGAFDEEKGQSREIAARLPHILGEGICRVLKTNPAVTLMVIGGDTLNGFVQAAGIHALEPQTEMLPGVVLTHFLYGNDSVNFISKAGSFGGETLLLDLMSKLKKNTFIKNRQL